MSTGKVTSLVCYLSSSETSLFSKFKYCSEMDLSVIDDNKKDNNAFNDNMV